MPRKATHYTDPEVEGGQYQHNISRTALGKMGKKRQQDIMRQWFYERYEDPVNSQPYDSEEGGYIYVNGGPFDAREELEAEFSPIVKQAVIDELAKELEDVCMDWTHTDSYDLELYPEDFYEINASLDNQTPLENLRQSLVLLQRLLAEKDQMDHSLHKFQLMMIYIFCITSLETYLSDVFAKHVMNDTELKKKYLGSEKSLKEQKISLSQVFDKYEEIDDLIKKEISNTTFHNLRRVKWLFQEVLNVDIGDISNLANLIHKRHDFIHRGGKDTEGREVITTKLEVEDLIKAVEDFCAAMDAKIFLIG
jgi:uncharacterized protein YdcH (DUF465 family)